METRGTLEYNIILQLDLVYKQAEKWSKVPYVQLLFVLRDHPDWLSECLMDLSVLQATPPQVSPLEKLAHQGSSNGDLARLAQGIHFGLTTLPEGLRLVQNNLQGAPEEIPFTCPELGEIKRDLGRPLFLTLFSKHVGLLLHPSSP